MSRNSNDADGCALGIFGLLALGVMAVFNLFRTPTEERLRKLNQPADWGSTVQGIVCPKCNQTNEFTHTVCWSCGSPLEVVATNNQAQALGRFILNLFVLAIIISGMLLLGILAMLAIAFVWSVVTT